MKEQITEKLSAVLSDGVVSECKVVYVLCETRKLLDKYPPDPMPLALKLYCHWALHIDLTNPGTTAHLMERVDDFVDRIILRTEDFIQDERLFQDLLSLETFRRQLAAFLHMHDLPTSICDVDRQWHEFLTHYAGVIEDGSLSCQSRNQRLRHVSKLIFSKGRERKEAFVPFDLVWEVVLLDGRSICINGHTAPLPNGKPMRLGGIELRKWK